MTSSIKAETISGDKILCLVNGIDVTDLKDIKYNLQTQDTCSVSFKRVIPPPNSPQTTALLQVTVIASGIAATNQAKTIEKQRFPA